MAVTENNQKNSGGKFGMDSQWDLVLFNLTVKKT